jgi:hypothetical protein
MDLDSSGEIVVSGVRLRDILPPAAYEIFLKGLGTEIADASVEVPQSNAIALPSIPRS